MLFRFANHLISTFFDILVTRAFLDSNAAVGEAFPATAIADVLKQVRLTSSSHPRCPRSSSHSNTRSNLYAK